MSYSPPQPGSMFFDRHGHTVRVRLEGQLAQLNRVIADCTWPEVVAIAVRYARRISAWLETNDGDLWSHRGMFFENGWEPAVDNIVRQAARCEPVHYVERVAA